jgi:hypothetical protein
MSDRLLASVDIGAFHFLRRLLGLTLGLIISKCSSCLNPLFEAYSELALHAPSRLGCNNRGCRYM